MTEQPAPPGNIMAVDDNPTNLRLLEDMLRRQRYVVRSFRVGRLALVSAQQQPPDLILLDINMPEMNGYEVCQRLKSDPHLCDIPVIFISALNATEDKVKGLRAGGADYVSKPFQFEEVQARVETHLKLRRAQQAERDLLERTLGGAVSTLLELVQITSPALALRCREIRDIVLWITKRMAIPEAWQYEVAATLCLVGCIALPDDVFERAYRGEALSPDEDQMFRTHPETAARLLSAIPRLEVVAEMIRSQQMPPPRLSATVPVEQGLLQLALELNRSVYRGVAFHDALTGLRSLGRFDGRMLDALQNYSPAPAEFELRGLRIRELRPGMVLDENVFTKDGNLLILQAGTVLTETWIERLENFAKIRGIELMRIRIPKSTGSSPARIPALGSDQRS